MSENTFDVIVIGVGGLGSATVYQLAKRGKKVLGIERFGIPHEMGSSHGLTRIIRLAYYEDPSYVPLMHRAYELWHDIETELDAKLLYTTGSIDAGPEGDDVFSGSLESCQVHGLEHEVLTSKELTARFPGYRFPTETMALFQPQGGLLVPERCIEGYAKAAQKLGATIHTEERTLDWEPTAGGGVRVTTDKGTYEAGSLVVAAGAWAYKMIPILEGIAVPERQVLIWMEVQEPDNFKPENFPVFNCRVEEGRYYGFPEFNPSGNTPGFKFGRWHHLEEVVDPDTIDRTPNDADEKLLRTFGERYFPGAGGRTLNLKACMFTNTNDEHFVLDTLPDHPQVSVAAGMSGHGFKFCSVIGEVMADLATDGDTRHDISLLRLNQRQPV